MSADTARDDDLALLLVSGATPHRVSLEDCVAYQRETSVSLSGELHARLRNEIALRWLRDAVEAATRPARVLDVGCAYGHHLLMLNAMLGKPADVEFHGVDLHERSVEWGNAFARRVPGYANCHFATGDIALGLPFDDGTFHAVNFCDVLEHLPDPEAALIELRRVSMPGATIVVSTPLRGGAFKQLAELGNRLSRGRLYATYYRGKDTELDELGRPIMETPAGYGHISELTADELLALVGRVGLSVDETQLMPVVSGSDWIDRHLAILSTALLLEGLHRRLRWRSWAHSIMLRLRTP